MAATSSTACFKVLMFPWLANGHISPYLELAKKLSTNHFHVYFCSTAINLASIKKRSEDNSWDFPIEFVELQLPHIPELPPQHHTTKDLPADLLPVLHDAFRMSKHNFGEILSSLKPDLLIYDSFQSWAAELASSLDVPAVHFFICGTASISFYHHHSTKRPDGIISSYPFPEIYLKDAEIKKLSEFNKSDAQVSEELAFKSFDRSCNVVLINSCREIEGKYLDYFSSVIGKKIVPLGPLVQEVKLLDSHQDIIDWLNNKKQSSVVFVCFGTEYLFSKEELEEIASGLELSNANFLWVVRSIKEALPQGFLERVKNRGMVVEGWAPQAKILQHPNVGGFVSHCGWNSLMESLCYCVAVIAIPLNYDQPTNARLLENLGAGLEVPRDEEGKLQRQAISDVIKKVLEEKEGEIFRGKAEELSKNMNMEKEGNMNTALEQLWKICHESKFASTTKEGFS